MLPAIATSIKQRLSANIRCLYLNSPAMVAGMRSYLFALDVDVNAEVEAGNLIFSSDQSQLQNGAFDGALMLQRLEEAVCQALSGGWKGLFATGDMTWELGRDRDLQKLVDYEWELEKLFQKYPQAEGVCQYHLGTLPVDFVCNGLANHRAVYINQRLSHRNPSYIPSGGPRKAVAPPASLKYTVENLCALQPGDAPDSIQ
jgi:hypothetical protein